MNPVIGSSNEGPINTSVTFQARLTALTAGGAYVANEGAALVAADVASIHCRIYYLGTMAQLQTTPVPDPELAAEPAISSSAIGDELVADSYWVASGRQIDSVGRNFLHTTSYTFPVAGVYRAVYAVTLTGGECLEWAQEYVAVDPLAP